MIQCQLPYIGQVEEQSPTTGQEGFRTVKLSSSGLLMNTERAGSR